MVDDRFKVVTGDDVWHLTRPNQRTASRAAFFGGQEDSTGRQSAPQSFPVLALGSLTFFPPCHRSSNRRYPSLDTVRMLEMNLYTTYVACEVLQGYIPAIKHVF